MSDRYGTPHYLTPIEKNHFTRKTDLYLEPIDMCVKTVNVVKTFIETVAAIKAILPDLEQKLVEPVVIPPVNLFGS